MDLAGEQIERLCRWAQDKRAINAVWLFGSRSRGPSPESDIDLGLELAPEGRAADWAFYQYWINEDSWKAELEHLLGTKVDLVVVGRGSEADRIVREADCELWRRT